MDPLLTFGVSVVYLQKFSLGSLSFKGEPRLSNCTKSLSYVDLLLTSTGRNPTFLTPLFKPQQRYESSLLESCRDLSCTAVDLIQTLLSVDPYKRGNASSSLCTEYFTTEPFVCEPSSLPKYAPSKEIDAKVREDTTRKKTNGRVRGHEMVRKTTKKLSGSLKLAPTENFPLAPDPQRVKVNENLAIFQPEGDIRRREPPKASVHRKDEKFHLKHASQGDVPYSGPLPVPVSSGFAWAKNRKDDANVRSHRRPSSKLSFNGLETYLTSHDRSNSELKKQTVKKQWSQFEGPDSFDISEEYHSQEISLALYKKEGEAEINYTDQEDKVEFSGPLLSQPNRVDDLLEKHERQIRQAVRRTWFQKGRK